MCDSASTTTPETPWGSNRWNATSITVARDALAAPIIISRTASTSVSAAASQPDNSHTMCVPSAFNFSALLEPRGNPTSGLVGWRLLCSVTSPTYRRTLAGAFRCTGDSSRWREKGAPTPYRGPTARGSAQAQYPRSGEHNNPPDPPCKPLWDKKSLMQCRRRGDSNFRWRDGALAVLAKGRDRQVVVARSVGDR